MDILVWHDKKAVHVLGLDVSSIGFWLTSDHEKRLPDSFSLLINARVFGMQVGQVTIEPVKDTPVSMPLLASVGGTVDGKISNWGALDKSGKPVDGKADPDWKTADAVGFLLNSIADVTIPASAIIALVPGIGWLAKAALAVLGNKVKITIAHEQVVAHLPHGSAALAETASISNAVGASVK